MRSFVIYWVIGCVLIGVAVGKHERRCPHDSPPSLQNELVLIAIWPASFAAYYVNQTEPEKCEVLQ